MVVPRLLVVDDEPALLNLLRKFLEKAGYTVVAAASGEDALSLLAAAPETFAMVITDLTMEKMGGEELVARIREIRPRIPALLMSGYPHVPVVGNTGFLQKPFLPDMLTAAVKKALRESVS